MRTATKGRTPTTAGLPPRRTASSSCPQPMTRRAPAFSTSSRWGKLPRWHSLLPQSSSSSDYPGATRCRCSRRASTRLRLDPLSSCPHGGCHKNIQRSLTLALQESGSMTLPGPLRLGVRMTLAFVLGATLLLAMAAPAHANGVHVGSRQVFEGDVGPYRLTLTTTPVVGSMHFIILLSNAGDESPVSDPELTMRGVFIDGEGLEVGPVAGYATDGGAAVVRRGPARGDGGPMGVHPDRGRLPWGAKR